MQQRRKLCGVKNAFGISDTKEQCFLRKGLCYHGMLHVYVFSLKTVEQSDVHETWRILCH